MTELLRRWAFGKAQTKSFVFWKKDSQPIELWSRPATVQKISYIHNNAGEAGIVTEAHHYRLSSAHPDGPLLLNGYLERVEAWGMFERTGPARPPCATSVVTRMHTLGHSLCKR